MINMFYCDECGKKKKWPKGLVQSYGPCEICGKKAMCSDISSSHLPNGIIKCPKCGQNALYDIEQGDMAIHTFINGPFILPTDVCHLGFVDRYRARKLLKQIGV